MIRVRASLALLLLVVLPATAHAGGSVYVTTAQGIAQYEIGAGGRLSPLKPATVAGGSYEIALAPDGKSAYATGDNGVFQYDVDPRTGSLSPKSPPFVSAPSGSVDRTLDTFGLAVTPDGKRIYVGADQPHGGTAILQYDVGPAQGLVSLNLQNLAGGGPYGRTEIAVTPDGQSAYANNLFSHVVQFTIDPYTGFLSPKSTPEVPAAPYVLDVAVTGDSRSAYATTSLNGVFQYSIDPIDGALSPKNPPAVGTGAYGGIAIAPNDKSAYIACASAVCQYDIDPTSGALSPKSPPAVDAGGPTGNIVVAPDNVAVSPDGKSAYVAVPSANAVSQYDIDPVTGGLSPKTPATVSVSGPVGVATGALPRVPTSSEQCKHRGWRNFLQFENQGRCVAFVAHG